MIENGLLLGKNECFYNSRTKCYIGADGELVPYELMVANRQIFSDGGNEVSDYTKEVEYQLEYRKAASELFGGEFGEVQHFIPSPKSKEEILDASRRRARRKVFDYCICNDFDIFITLTLDSRQIDRHDYQAVIKRLTTFLDNRVRRKGLKYLGVPEYHKNGGLHFHFAATSCAFRLVDSGTVSVEGIKRPMKRTTAERKQIPQDIMHTVYNIVDWKLGFSTAIYLYGDKGKIAHYIAKELCKDEQKQLVKNGSLDKIGGRWYYHGGKLNRPICLYDNKSYSDLTQYSYSVSTDGGEFKVYKFGESGEIIK